MKRKAPHQLDRATLERYNYNVPDEVINARMGQNPVQRIRPKTAHLQGRRIRRIIGVKPISLQKKVVPKNVAFTFAQGIQNPDKPAEQNPQEDKKEEKKEENTNTNIQKLFANNGTSDVNGQNGAENVNINSIFKVKTSKSKKNEFIGQPVYFDNDKIGENFTGVPNFFNNQPQDENKEEKEQEKESDKQPENQDPNKDQNQLEDKPDRDQTEQKPEIKENNPQEESKKEEGLFGNNNNSGIMFSNSLFPKTNNTNSLFGNTSKESLKDENQGNNLFGTGLFGNSDSNANQTSGLFGIINTEKDQTSGLFANTDKPSTEGLLFNKESKSGEGGLFDNNKKEGENSDLLGGGNNNLFADVKQGSLFSDLKNPENESKGSGLFNFLSQSDNKASNKGPYSQSFFPNIGGNSVFDNQGQKEEEKQIENQDNQLKEADKSQSKADYKYEEIYEKLFEKDIKIIKTNNLAKCNLGCVQLVKLIGEDDSYLILYRSTTKTIMYQARLFPNAEVKYLNNRQDVFSVPVIYSKKKDAVEGEEEQEEKINMVLDSLMIKFLTRDDSSEFAQKIKKLSLSS